MSFISDTALEVTRFVRFCIRDLLATDQAATLRLRELVLVEEGYVKSAGARAVKQKDSGN